MNVSDLLINGSISYIEQIHDRVPDRQPGEPEYCNWYNVHIEPAEQDIVQVITMTVTDGELETFLTSMGWSWNTDDIRHVYQNN